MHARWLVAWVAIAWPAAAAAEPTVLLWPRTPAQESAAVEEAARASGWAVLPFAPVGARLREVAAREAARARDVRARAVASLAAVQRAYLDLKYDEMLATLEALERDALSVLAAGRDPVAWEMEVHAGLAHLGRAGPGDAERARLRFARALSLDPDRRPASDVYGPAVARAFAEVVTAAGAGSEVDVAIEIEPGDAQVVIDQIPLTSRRVRLRPGPHLVHARAPGHLSTSQWIAVTPGALRLKLEPAAGDDALERLAVPWEQGELRPDAPSTRRSLLAAAASLGAPTVVVVESTPAGGSAQLVTAARGDAPVVRPALAAAVRAALAPLRPARRAIAPPPTRDEPPPLYRRWWVWAGAAAVVVGAIAISLAVTDEPGRLELVAPP